MLDKKIAKIELTLTIAFKPKDKQLTRRVVG